MASLQTFNSFFGLLTVLLATALFPGPIFAHNNGTISTWITCRETPKYDQFGVITGYNTYAESGNDHMVGGSISGGPTSLGGGGGDYSYTYQVDAIQGHSGTMTQCTGTAQPTSDPNPQPSQPPPSTGCQMVLEKTAEPTTVSNGQEVTFTVNIKNTGSISCTGGGAKIVDEYDSRLEYISGTQTQSSNFENSWHDDPPHNESTHTLSWNGYDLEPGESGFVKWTAKVPTVSGCVEISNTAKATAEELNDYQTWVKSNVAKVKVGGSACTTPSPAPTPPPPPASGPPPPPPAVGCPSTTSVFLATANIKNGETTTVYAPSGWTGGIFSSSNPNVAKIISTSGNSASVLGVNTGNATITGSNWTKPDSSGPCNLNGSTLQVSGPPVGIISGTLEIDICQGKPAGSATLTINANVYSELTVYGAVGVEDGSVLAGIPANLLENYTTGDIITQATLFKLIAPYDDGVELDSQTMSVNEINCPGSIFGPQLESANVYNTTSLPPALKSVYGEVACGELLAVWKLADTSGPVQGFRVINTDTGIAKTINDPLATFLRFAPTELSGTNNPYALYSYAVEAFNGTQTSRLQAGRLAALWPCTSNIDQSNQDIVFVRNTSIFSPSHIRNLKSDAEIQSVTPIKEGDKVIFRIHIINNGNENHDQPLNIRVNLTGVGPLDPQELDWNERILCGDGQVECQEAAITSTNYSRASNRLTLDITPQGGEVLEPGEVWSLEFTGQTRAPVGFTGEIFKMQSIGYIDGFTSPALQTPVLPVIRNLGVPEYEEVP